MKTELNRAGWLVMAAFVVTTVQQAAAWYSPSQQRWINRDPIEEQGGLNLYGFVRNAPTHKHDSFGLYFGGGPPPDPDKPAETPDECAQRIYEEVRDGPRPDIEDPSNRYGHCLASCRITRECGAGRFVAWIAGDWWRDPWWKEDPDGDAEGDRAANKVGRKAGTWACRKTCTEACMEAFKKGKLYPPRRPTMPRVKIPPLFPPG